MVKLDLGTLNAKQEEFLNAVGVYRYICYGGARGGGKTHALRIIALLGAALKYPGIRILILRRTYPELEANHIAPMRKMVPSELGTYNIQMHQFYFENGSTIKYGHFQSYDSAFQEYQGQEYDWIMMDEATQFTEDEFRLMGGCLRGVNDIPKTFFLTCNPGGIGHFWVKRLFIDRDFKKDGSEEERENPRDYKFIQALVTDNKAMMKTADGKNYLKMLSSLPENIRKAHRYGDWDILSGNYFPEFGPKHIIDPIQIKRHWAKYRAFDYGLDMLAVGWFAIDERGYTYLYRELLVKDLPVSDAAQVILGNTGIGENIITTFAPSDIWSRTKDSGKSMAELFMVNGVPIVKADRTRVQGWLQVKEFLKEDGKGIPYLRVFNTCRETIRCMKSIQTDTKNPNDCATQPHELTHACDMIRYFCLSRTQPGKLPEPEVYHDEFEKEEYEVTGGEITGGYINYG